MARIRFVIRGLAMFALVLTLTMQSWMVFAQDGRTTAMPPVAPVRPVVEDYFGTKVTDLYRYMENLKDPEVMAWMKAQNDYTRGVLARIPGRDALLSRVRELDASVPARLKGVRRLANGHYFYLKSLSAEIIYKLYMRQGAAGAESLLVDPGKSSTEGGPPSAIDYFAPSDDGRYVAYGISTAGSEQAVLHVLDTKTGRETGEAIDRADFGYVIGWLPDGHSFMYNRLQRLAANASPEEREIKSRVYLHQVGTDGEHDTPVFGYGVSPLAKAEPADVSFVATVPGVPLAFGILQHGARNELTMYLAPLKSVGTHNTPWKKVCDVDDDVTMVAASGDDLWLLTHKDAPRFKVVHTSLSKPDLSHAQVVVPASDAVITDLRDAQDGLYVQLRDGAVHRLLRIGHEAGVKPEQVGLPIEGSIRLFDSDPSMPGVLFELTGWTRASLIYEYDPRTRTVADTKLRPAGPFDAPTDIEAEEVKVASWDGTLIPLSILHRRGLRLDGLNPTLLDGYGAYGISIDPYFDPMYLAWLERGGVLAIAHVRGGGEFGDDWHKAGQKLTKPNTWKDFVACAEYLRAKRYTSPTQLSGMGGSAGGILIGRAITERPDLFAAALIEVGFTDTLRGEFEQNGPGEIAEWGTVKDPEGFKGLYEMSAYAHVTDGTRYPGVMLITGSNDPRVSPFEPAKMTARLQAATASGRPVLLRVDYEAGHGIGSTKTQLEERLADEWAFLFWQLGAAGFQATGAAHASE